DRARDAPRAELRTGVEAVRLEPNVRSGMYFYRARRGGRAVECTGLENQRACKGTVGSNPTPSAFGRLNSCRFLLRPEDAPAARRNLGGCLPSTPGVLALPHFDEVAELPTSVMNVHSYSTSGGTSADGSYAAPHPARRMLFVL